MVVPPPIAEPFGAAESPVTPWDVALQAGATTLMKPTDEEDGDRRGGVRLRWLHCRTWSDYKDGSDHHS